MGSRGNFLVLVFFLLFAPTFGSNELMDRANALYAKQQYEAAIPVFEKVLDDRQESPELYYNLGNCYYKLNKIGKAILYYERAKKLAPDDEDIQFNLKMANQKVEDRIEAAPELFVKQWKNSLSSGLSERNWAIISILFMVLSFFFWGVFRYGKRIHIRQWGFYLGTTGLVLGIISFFFARNAVISAQNSKESIILAPSVTVLGSPDSSGTKLFILHEGTKVEILDASAGWQEVKIANGNTGWIPSNSVETI